MSRARYRLLVLAPSLAIAGLLLLPAQGDAIFGCGIDPLCMIGKGIGGAVSSVAGDAITALAKSVLGALGHAVEWASTLWVGIGTPPVADASGQATGTVAFLQQNLLVFTTGLAVLCTLLGAGRIVYHEHKSAQLRELGRYLATYVLISGAAAGAASVLIGGCDQMASWFIAARAAARASPIISRTCSASRPSAPRTRRGRRRGSRSGWRERSRPRSSRSCWGSSRSSRR